MVEIRKSEPRNSVQVTLPDGRIYEGEKDSPLLDFIQQAEQDAQTPTEERAFAAMIDNRLRELRMSVQRDMTILPLAFNTLDGVRIYRRSLAFLLVAAAHEIFPDISVFIDHSLPQRGFFCHVEGRENLTNSELKALKAKMRDMVAADLPIERTRMSLDEAKAYFEARNDLAKVRLLQFRTRDYLRVYRLGDFSDYFFGYMVPSTGYLNWFNLELTDDGFILLYPNEDEPIAKPKKMKQVGKLDAVFQQTMEWLRLLDVRDIGQLNGANKDGRLRELILIAEALHERRIAEIGQQITERHVQGVRLILIAGPSSSGKTTFAKRLAIQLMSHGLKTFTLELDNYFVDREDTPLDENGEYDFEALGAINVDLLNRHLQALIAGKPVQLPKFDFFEGKSLPGKNVQLSGEHVIILEGIHGLNPNLTPAIDASSSFRIYVSALTQLNIDRYNRVSTTDVRLLRRIVRDAMHRGWSATDTLSRWESVGRGEKRYIFPYQEEADVMFNSALMYELAIIRPLAEPHLFRVRLDHPKWAEANRLLSFLAWVSPASDEGIPDNSILREFIGGSNLRDYHPGA